MHMQPSALPFSRLVGSPTVEPTDLREAARQFESLFTKELLKAARSAGDALAEDKDSTAEGYLDFAESALADALAEAGTLGLGGLILKHLEIREVSADKG